MTYAMAMGMLPLVAMFMVGGGCTTDPDLGVDAGVAQSERCTLKVNACINSCYKADMGLACRMCCRRNGSQCDADAGYSFYSCLED